MWSNSWNSLNFTMLNSTLSDTRLCWNFGIELHLLSQTLLDVHTRSRSLSLTNLSKCWNEIEKYKYWNKDCSQTRTEYLREILLDSGGSNVSVQEMMQSLWWWPWWWNRHKQYTKQTYHTGLMDLSLHCSSEKKIIYIFIFFLASGSSFLLWASLLF